MVRVPFSRRGHHVYWTQATHEFIRANARGAGGGLLVGVGFGEYMAPLQDVGRAFILLLQMPVLPYITCR
jgi:hypothetical protein